MDNKELSEQYIARANASRKAGWTIEIHHGLEYISIQHDDYPDDGWFVTGEAFDNLVESMPDFLEVCLADYLLAQSQNW